MDDDQRIAELLASRTQLLSELLDEIREEVSRPPVGGSLDEEIAEQREAADWDRAATPLQTSGFAAMRYLACAAAHARLFLLIARHEGMAATADLLVRAALENLAFVCWLMEDGADATERSGRALADVAASNRELKKFYRAQGSVVDPNGKRLDERGKQVSLAAGHIAADAKRLGGSPKLGDRPGFTEVVDEILFEVDADGARLRGGALYRLLSGSVHGNKWALERHSEPADKDGRVAFTATPAHTEMLMFYLGIALLKARHCCAHHLHWPPATQGVSQQVFDLGPCVIDVGG